MDAPQTKPGMAVEEVLFPNGNRARLARPPAGASAAEVIAALGLEKPKALLIVVGGAGELDKNMQAQPKIKSRLEQLFGRGLARAARDVGAAIIDGGTHSGVMALMGQAVADQGRKTTLLGVAPAGKVAYPGRPAADKGGDTPLDPEHTHFVLVETAEWGGETEFLFELAAVLGEGIPVVTVLVGGRPGRVAQDEVLRSVRRGWPVVVVQGSGPLPDKLACEWRKKRRAKKPRFIPDPALAEIIADGDLHLWPLKGRPEELPRLIVRLVVRSRGTGVVHLAWRQCTDFAASARRHQRVFYAMQLLILSLGFAATLLALIYAQFGLWSAFSRLDWLDEVFKGIIVAVPLASSVLIAVLNHLKLGNKWVLLRAGAEQLKREIFRYRTRAGIYSDEATKEVSREEKLARKVGQISRAVMATEVNTSALPPRSASPLPSWYPLTAEDNGYNFISPERYLTVRVDDQIRFYEKRIRERERELVVCQWIIISAGAIGSLLAALGQQLWVALTTALATTLVALLEYRQVETTLTNYNQAATDLNNLRVWWAGLSAAARADPKNISDLVEHSEQIMAAEQAGWVQRMQDALEKLASQEAGATPAAASTTEAAGSGKEQEQPTGEPGEDHDGPTAED